MVAKCCCGEVTVEVQDKPLRHGMCHCDNCKKRTGSAFGLSAYFEASDVVSINGETSCYKLNNKHDGSDQERYFCKACGSTVYWRTSTFPDLIGIATGCFVEPSVGEPGYSVSNESRWPWVSLPRGVKESS